LIEQIFLENSQNIKGGAIAPTAPTLFPPALNLDVGSEY
jgi:hypothetical protein